jgi:3-hydroxy-9,10-secoandrosta-1,3,5(10)-triene-9,17-dione monooxygenase
MMTALGASNLTREELIGRAREMIPTLRERAPECEARGRILESTNRDFHDAGFYRIYQPRRYGGLEADFQLQVDIGAETGQGCGSSTWVLTILASHSWVVGMMDERAQDDVWRDDNEALVANSFPVGGATTKRVKGGYELNGTWTFSSGIDVSTWSCLNVMVPNAGGPPIHHFMMVPKSDIRVIDNWDSNGLRGTGSKDIVLEDVFVPDYRTLNTHKARGGPTPGSAVNPNPLYKIPLFGGFTMGIIPPAIGLALGALDILIKRMTGRVSSTGFKLADSQAVQLRLAEAASEIECARLLMNADCAEFERIAASGEEPTDERRVRYRKNAGYAATLCMRAIDRLLPLVGANGLGFNDPIQRAWRDIHAVSAHFALTWDTQATQYGGVLLGKPPADPKL